MTSEVIFRTPVLLVASTDQFYVIEPGETYTREELYNLFPEIPDEIEVVPLGEIRSYQEKMLKVNNVIDTIQEKGLKCYNNTYTIPRTLQ